MIVAPQMNGSPAFKCVKCDSITPHEGVVRTLASSSSLDEFLNGVQSLIDVQVERKPLYGDMAGFDEDVYAKVRFWCQSCGTQNRTPRNTQFELLLDQMGGIIGIGCLSEKS